jgi:hypothetical protein
MKPETMDARDTELRRALVATVDLTPFTRRRPSKLLVIGALVTFAAAGALTGGGVAFAAASQIGTLSAAANYELSEAAQSLTTSSAGNLLGAPIANTAEGTLEVPLVSGPDAATNVVLGFECKDPGTYTVKLDSTTVAREKCEAIAPLSGIGNGGVVYPDDGKAAVVQDVTLPAESPSAILIPTNANTTALTIDGPNSGRFATWISWVVIPPLAPSAAEQAELADGVVTRAEYLAAMNRFIGCVTARGFSLSEVDMTGPLVGFTFQSSTPAAAGAETRCFDTEAEGVHAKWIEEGEGR